MTHRAPTAGTSTAPEACMRAANALKQCLLTERDALGGGDAETLNLAIEAKAAQLRKLQHLLKGTPEGVALRSLRANDATEDAAAQSPWQTFMSLLAECESLNNTNGAAIRLRRQQVHHNLAVLRGQNTVPDIYGPQGNADASQAGRPLTEA